MKKNSSRWERMNLKIIQNIGVSILGFLSDSRFASLCFRSGNYSENLSLILKLGKKIFFDQRLSLNI